MNNIDLEYLVLIHCVELMDINGRTNTSINLSINQKLLDTINSMTPQKFSIDQLYKAGNKCLARKWLDHADIGGDNYTSLKITESGVGVARSKLASSKIEENKTSLKKISDFFESHNGLIIFLSLIASIAATIISLFALFR